MIKVKQIDWDRSQLPNAIKILSVDWKIEYIDVEEDVNPDADRLLHGHLSWRTVTMRIFRGTRNVSSIWQTIWHEIFHVLIEYAQLSIKYEETFCCKMGVAMNDIFQQNFMPREVQYEKRKSE